MKRIALAIVAAGIVAACTPTSSGDVAKATAKAGDIPANYRQQIVQNVEQTYYDPYTIRSAQIAEPFLFNDLLSGSMWIVCTRFNAKNKYGAYTGTSVDAFVFQHGRVIEVSFSPENNCSKAVYAPFPELENI